MEPRFGYFINQGIGGDSVSKGFHFADGKIDSRYYSAAFDLGVFYNPYGPASPDEDRKLEAMLNAFKILRLCCLA